MNKQSRERLIRTSWIAILVLFVLSSVVIAALLVHGSKTNCALRLSNGKCVSLERVSTPIDRERGLSGRMSMPEDRGMLFVFEKAQQQCFWMKDMHFSLDIIWVDSQKKVVGIERGVSPASYPSSYCSHKPVQYVIEVNVGVSKQAGVQVGSQLSL